MLVKAKINESAWIFCAKTKKSEISLIKFNSTVYKIEKEMIAPNQYASPVSLFCLKTNPNSIAVCYTVNEGKTELVILSVKDLKIHHRKELPSFNSFLGADDSCLYFHFKHSNGYSVKATDWMLNKPFEIQFNSNKPSETVEFFCDPSPSFMRIQKRNNKYFIFRGFFLSIFDQNGLFLASIPTKKSFCKQKEINNHHIVILEAKNCFFLGDLCKQLIYYDHSGRLLKQIEIEVASEDFKFQIETDENISLFDSKDLYVPRVE